MGLNLVMLGPPGAGKGTQAEGIAKTHGIPKISTGDILREAVAAGTELGRQAKATMDRGGLLSDDIVVGIVRERLSQADAARGFVLDGFPRTVAQAEALDGMMEGRAPLVIVDLVVPEDELVRRLSARRVCGRCGATVSARDREPGACPACDGRLVQRSDDREDVVRERLQVYLRQTQPLVEYYRKRATFRSVDGMRAPGEVTAALGAAVESAVGATS